MRKILLTLVATSTAIASLAGQQAPDLTGTWVLDLTRSDAAAAEGHLPGEPHETHGVTLVIQHRPDALVVERRHSNGSEVFRYPFNETEIAAPQRADEPSGQRLETGGSGDGVPNAVPTSGAPHRDRMDAPAVLGFKVHGTSAEVRGERVKTRLAALINGQTVTTDDTLYLSADRQELIVERVLQVHHGYEGLTKASGTATGKDVFVRSQ